MTRPNVAIRQDGSSVLGIALDLDTEGHDLFDAEDIVATQKLPRLDVGDVEYVLKFLKGQSYIEVASATYGGKIYRLTDRGRQKAWHQRSSGKSELDFADPDRVGPQINVGQGASNFQAPIHAGTGDIHLTQNNAAPVDQAQILDMLARLSAALEQLREDDNRDLTQMVVQKATVAAQEGDWQTTLMRVSAAVTFLSSVASLAVDGTQALELGRQIIHRLGGA